MDVSRWLGFAGLGAGLIGSGLLAFSLNRVINALALATDAHDLAIEGLLADSASVPIVRFTGTDVHVKKGQQAALRMTWTGLWMLAVSFALQGVALFLTASG